ncbi:MAG: hypothetical protein AAGI17_10390 [Planctomycetota bacterium]
MVPAQQHVVGLDAAQRWLIDRARMLESPVLIGVTGPVGSGKSTLAGLLADTHEASVLTTDRYLPDYAVTPEHLRDSPESSDLPRLAADLADLAAGRPATVPIWSFYEHRRTGEEPIDPAGLVVCEGLHALSEHVRELYTIRVFVFAPADTREKRWTDIAARGERGWSVEQTRSFMKTVADPVFHERAEAYRDAADLVVENPDQSER